MIPGLARPALARPALARPALALLAALVAVGACAPTTPAPLPSGATQLILATQPAPAIAVDVGGCSSAGVEPVHVAVDNGAMLFDAVQGGERRQLVWPAGFSARLLGGVGELVTPLGNVYARQGDVLSSLQGSPGDNGEILLCFASSDEYRNSPSP